MAQKICTICGYEGRGKNSGKRRGGGLFRLLGILTMLPFHSIWQLFWGGGKFCPQCGTKTMVGANSGEGRFMRQKMDIELGALKPKAENKVEGFGNERPTPKVETKKPVNPDQF